MTRGVWPALVYFHGGGWVVGDLDSTESQCGIIAREAGCKVVSVQYRLAPEHKFPAGVEDAYAATGYISKHASDLGIDPTRLAVGGDSAGGNLAAVVSWMAKDRGGPPICYQLLIYPITDFSFTTPSYIDYADGYLLTQKAMEWYWKHYLNAPDEGHHPYCSIMRAAYLQGLPPALIITAEFDPLRDEGEAYGRRLKESGVQAEIRRYDGMIHGFLFMDAALPQGRQGLKDCAAALRLAFNR